MSVYTPTIGIEVHAELTTQSKMFCSCVNDPHASKPNTHICPVCLAHPGTLPSVNKTAIEKVLLVGKALNSQLATFSEFDRKNYFYPDIPKAYQLSQYAFPFVTGGTLAEVVITRVHLEEDTARSTHEHGVSLVDFNRAGVPLMELVTEPVIHDVPTAVTFVRELQLLLRTLGVSDAHMEKGEMRVEANISVSANKELGKKVEVKNLNSFKAFELAIDHEIRRQSRLLEQGESITQETRGWDENTQKTFSQRIKETAEDYRYFPDPDIPKMDLSAVQEFSNSRIEEIMPILPNKIRMDYKNLGLTSNQIEILLQNAEAKIFFDAVITEITDSHNQVKLAANYILTDILSLASTTGVSLKNADAQMFVQLLQMIDQNVINSRVAKDLLQEVVFESKNPKDLAQNKGLLQLNSEDALIPVVEDIIKEHSAVVEEYRSGKEASLKFLVGQGMKQTKGSANPTLLAELFKSRLN